MGVLAHGKGVFLSNALGLHVEATDDPLAPWRHLAGVSPLSQGKQSHCNVSKSPEQPSSSRMCG